MTISHLFPQYLILSLFMLSLGAVNQAYGTNISYEEEITEISESNKVARQLNRAENALTKLVESIQEAVQDTARQAAREAAEQAIIGAIEPTIKHAYKQALMRAALVERTSIEAAANEALRKQPANIRPFIQELKKNLLEKFEVQYAAKDRTSSEQVPGVIRQTIEARNNAEIALEELATAIKDVAEQAIAQTLPAEEEETDLPQPTMEPSGQEQQ